MVIGPPLVGVAEWIDELLEDRDLRSVGAKSSDDKFHSIRAGIGFGVGFLPQPKRKIEMSRIWWNIDPEVGVRMGPGRIREFDKLRRETKLSAVPCGRGINRAEERDRLIGSDLVDLTIGNDFGEERRKLPTFDAVGGDSSVVGIEG